MAAGEKEHDIYKKCNKCNGDGVLEFSKNMGDGTFDDITCDDCDGTGKVWWGETIKAD